MERISRADGKMTTVQEAIIGLDIGTTNAKAAVFTLTGRELASAEATYGITSPQPGWCEQDPEQVWCAVLGILRTVILEVGPDVRPIGMAVASQSGSLVATDAFGTPVYPCITWMDGRTEALVDEWVRAGVQDRVHAISGWHIHTGLPLASIAWLRMHNPTVFAATQRWLCMNDYITFRLTGRFVTNPSNAGVTQLLQATTPVWSGELCELVGVRPEQFSTVLGSGEMIGPITTQVSHETGLPQGMPIVNGGHDQCCTALALGVSQPGQILLACGTSWVVTGVVDHVERRAVTDALDLNYHTLPGRWTISRSLGGLGASMEWLVSQCWGELPDRLERYRKLDVEIDQTRPGCDGLFFIPMSGGHAAPAGMQRGGFVNLHLGHSRGDMARAAMESAAYELRMALENIGQGGLGTDGLWMFGGATRSSIWPSIVADVVGLPLRVTPSAHLPAVGAAILASQGVNPHQTAADAQKCFTQLTLDFQPDPINKALYDERFGAYRSKALEQQ